MRFAKSVICAYESDLHPEHEAEEDTLGRLHNKTLICEQFKPMFTINKSFISKITSATFPKSSLQESWVVSVATPVSIVRVGKPTPTCPKSLARPRWIEIFHNLCHLGPQCVPEPS